MKARTTTYFMFASLAVVHCVPRTPTDKSRECGRTYLRGRRIEDGEIVTYDHQPWNVALTRNGSDYPGNFCGGSLISENFVLTRASCVYHMPTESISAKLGDLDFMESSEEYRPEYYTIKRKILHEYYDKDISRRQSDIALLELSAPVVFKEHIAPICLPDSDAQSAGEKGIVTKMRWSHNSWSLDSYVSEKIDVEGPDGDSCPHWLSHYKETSDGFLCTWLREDSIGAQTKGPMILEKDGYVQIVGILFDYPVCWGRLCGAAYTEIADHVEWITLRIRPGFDHDNPRVERLYNANYDLLLLRVAGAVLIALTLILLLLKS